MARGTRSDARVASEGPRPTIWPEVKMARDRPSPYGETKKHSGHGEGQALALR